MPGGRGHKAVVRMRGDAITMREEQGFWLAELAEGYHSSYGVEELTKRILHLEVAVFVKLKLCDRILGKKVDRCVLSIECLQANRARLLAAGAEFWADIDCTVPLAAGC